MGRRQPRTTQTDTLCPYTTRVRSKRADGRGLGEPRPALDQQVSVGQQRDQQALDQRGLADDLCRKVLAQGGEQAVQAGGVVAGGVHGSTVLRRPDGVGCSSTQVRRQGSGRGSGFCHACGRAPIPPPAGHSTTDRTLACLLPLSPKRKRGPRAPSVSTRPAQPQLTCDKRRIAALTQTNMPALFLVPVLQFN